MKTAKPKSGLDRIKKSQERGKDEKNGVTVHEGGGISENCVTLKNIWQ